jgi:hypothetical protein
MLLLVHNIHTGLNLNILSDLEQNYVKYIDNYEGVIHNMKEFDCLYIDLNKDIKFSV